MCVLVRPFCVASSTSWFGVWCGGVWSGLGCCRAPRLLAGVLGCVRVCVCDPLAPRFSWGCAGVADGGFCLPPSPLIFFCGGALWCRLLVAPVLCLVVSVPPSLLFRAALFVVCFFFLGGVCPRVLGVSSPGGPLPSAWCCRFWLGGPPSPLLGVPSSVPSGCRVGRLLWCWWALWWLWAVVAPPPLIFFRGGSLPVPPSAFPGLAHALVHILCGFPVCCWWLRFAWLPRPHGSGGLCTRWARRPFLPGQVQALSGWQLCQAAACGTGLAVSFRLRGASCNFLAAAGVGGPPPLLPGARWPLAGGWQAGAAPSRVCGGLIWLDPQLASLTWCCGVLWCAVLRRAVF